MFLLGFRRKLTAMALCKSIESAIQRFQIHHRISLKPYKIQLYTFWVQGLAFFLPWFPDYRSSVFICGLIPRNFAELAEAVLIEEYSEILVLSASVDAHVDI